MNNSEWKLEVKETLTSPTLSREALDKLMDLKILHIPKRLFKCRGFSKHSISNCIDKTLFCADVDSFNDPYECSLQANLTPTVDLDRVLEDAAKDLESHHLDAIRALVESRYEQMSNEVSLSFRRKMKDIYKICALSERIDSILMWSHYADDHRGFAMEYDFHELSRRDPLVRSLWPVIYDSSMLDLTHLIASEDRRTDFNNLFGIAAAIHKTDDWQYEKEWRLIVHSASPKNVPAPLKAIYIGARAEAKDRSALIAAANFAGVPVHQMRLEERRFAMTYDQV